MIRIAAVDIEGLEGFVRRMPDVARQAQALAISDLSLIHI